MITEIELENKHFIFAEYTSIKALIKRPPQKAWKRLIKEIVIIYLMVKDNKDAENCICKLFNIKPCNIDTVLYGISIYPVFNGNKYTLVRYKEDLYSANSKRKY